MKEERKSLITCERRHGVVNAIYIHVLDKKVSSGYKLYNNKIKSIIKRET